MIEILSCGDTTRYKNYCSADFLVDVPQLTDFSFHMDLAEAHSSRHHDFIDDTQTADSTSSCGFQGSAIHIDKNLNVELACSADLPTVFVPYLDLTKRLLESIFKAERNGHRPDLTPLENYLTPSDGRQRELHERSTQYQQKLSAARRSTNQTSAKTRRGSLPDTPNSSLKRPRAKDKTATETEADEQGQEGGNDEAAELEPEWKGLNIFDDAAVLEYFTVCLKHIQQQTCRTIAQDWIRAIHPKKQAKYPYSKHGSKDKSNAPPWWPTGWKEKRDPPWPPKWWKDAGPPGIEPVPHIEPAHIKTRARIDLLLWILTHMDKWGVEDTGRPYDEDKNFFGHPSVRELEKATDENKSRYTEEAQTWLDRIYRVKQLWQEAREGGRGPGPQSVPTPWPRKGPRGGKKRQKVTENDASPAQPKEIAQESELDGMRPGSVLTGYDSDGSSMPAEWDTPDPPVNESPTRKALHDERRLTDETGASRKYAARDDGIQMEDLSTQTQALTTAPANLVPSSQTWDTHLFSTHEDPSHRSAGNMMQPIQQSVYAPNVHVPDHASGFPNASNQTERPTPMDAVWRGPAFSTSSAVNHGTPQAHMTQQQNMLHVDPRSEPRQPYLGLSHPGSEVFTGPIQQQQFPVSHNTAEEWRSKQMDPPMLVTQPPIVHNLRADTGPLSWNDAGTAYNQDHSSIYLPHQNEARIQQPVQPMQVAPGFGQFALSPPNGDQPHNLGSMNAAMQRLPPMPQYQNYTHSGHPHQGPPGY